MDWYIDSAFDDLIVPEYDSLSDRLPSPDSWSRWGISGPEIFQSHNKCGAFGAEFSAGEDDFNPKSLSDQVEMEDTVCDMYYDQLTISSLRNRPYYQLDLEGSGYADDIFLSSLEEEIPGIENPDKSFGSSPESHRGTEKSHCRERDMNLELQRASDDVLSLGSSRYLETHALSPSPGSEEDCPPESEIVAHNFRGKDRPFIMDPTAEECVPSEKNNVNGHADKETSLEEAVLLELKMVMDKLTEKTRICFRDALYRLAKNSDQHCTIQNQQRDLFMENPPRCMLDAEKSRSGTKRSAESRTNVVDRAIASLMFNTTRGLLVEEACGASHSQVPEGDAEVPIFCQMTNLTRSGTGSGSKPLV